MTYETFDSAKEAANYREDMAQESEERRVAVAEDRRREWAQRNGNDSGFDPYAYL